MVHSVSRKYTVARRSRFTRIFKLLYLLYTLLYCILPALLSCQNHNITHHKPMHVHLHMRSIEGAAIDKYRCNVEPTLTLQRRNFLTDGGMQYETYPDVALAWWTGFPPAAARRPLRLVARAAGGGKPLGMASALVDWKCITQVLQAFRSAALHDTFDCTLQFDH